ncbi:beta-lactamase-like protein [Pyronema omphalodes]|nr:beta-lactamase-like protein [Pyronema omphalodes]
MKVHATLITTPTSDTPGTSLIVHFDDRRYIFGHMAEGTQRACIERKARITKVQDIFLTGRIEWATTGGLVGFLLTVGDQRGEQLAAVNGPKGATPNPVTLHGGDNLLQTIAATRSFVFRGALKMRVDEIEREMLGKGAWKDGNVTVRALRISPSQPSSPKEGETTTCKPTSPKSPKSPGSRGKRSANDMEDQKAERIKQLKQVVKGMFDIQKSVNKSNEFEETDPLNQRGKRSRTSSEEGRGGGKDYSKKGQSQMAGNDMDRPLPPSEPSNVAMSYIMITHDHRGKFLEDKAQELGVPFGKIRGSLTRGESVTLENGRTVHPHEVLEPNVSGTGIAVCDLPDASYVDGFVSHSEWKDVKTISEKVGAFFWILGSGMSNHPKLVEFMKQFPEAKHIIAAEDVSTDRIAMGGAAKFAIKMNELDPGFYPKLHSAHKPAVEVPENTIAAETGLVFHIKPKWEVKIRDKQDEFQGDDEFNLHNVLENVEPEFHAIVAETHQDLQNNPPEFEEFPGSDVEVNTLGTGSSLPGRYRNVSATLITIPGNCSIFLDCGEGTIGQMKRAFGISEYEKRLLDVKVLYISHLHADHHLGSINMLKKQTQLLQARGEGNRPTYILAPERFWTWLQDYSTIEDFGLSRLIFLRNEYLRSSSIGSFATGQITEFKKPRQYTKMCEELGIQDWVTAPALHCQSSFTTAVTFKDGFKLAYSGDTRPTETFTVIGKDATLLVHEATFDDELIGEAIAKKHSTIGEAIQAGRDMKARKTALVHFSQRYPKAPAFAEDDKGDVVYGFDYMRFRVGEIRRFGRLVKGLETIFKDPEAEEELEGEGVEEAQK